MAHPAETQSGTGAFIRQYALSALIVAALILLLVQVQAGAESTAGEVVRGLPLGFAFGAGVLASVNPCGFLLLPAYISYHLGTEEEGYYQTPLALRIGRALLLGLVATVGFIVVFSGAGVVIAAGGQWLSGIFPLLGVAVGVVLVALGLWLLVTRRTLMLAAATRASVSPQRNLRNVFLFGVAYAIGSLGCTLPVFLGVLATAASSRDLVSATGQFAGYALGMGTVLMAVTLGAAAFRGAVGRALRGLVPHVHRMSVLFMIGAGLYLIYYWGIYAPGV